MRYQLLAAAFAGVVAWPSTALPCQPPIPGFNGGDRIETVPRNAVIAVAGSSIVPVEAVMFEFDFFVNLETELIANGFFGTQYVKATIAGIAAGGIPVTVTFSSPNVEERVVVELEVLPEEDHQPPVGPFNISAAHSYVDDEPVGSCFPNGSRVTITFAPAVDDFRVNYYTIERTDTFAPVGARFHHDADEFTARLYEGEDVGERCYRVVAHDIGGNTSTSDEVCVNLGPDVIQPDAGSPSDTGMPRPDAGQSPVDTGTTPDIGGLVREDGGCGCRTEQTSSSTTGLLVGFVLLVGLASRRRGYRRS